VVLPDDGDVVDADVAALGGAGCVVAGEGSGSANDGVVASLEDEHGAAEGAAANGVVVEEVHGGLLAEWSV